MSNRKSSKKVGAISQNVVTYFIGIVFILSSVTKAVALQVFADELQLYLDIYFGGWLRDYKLFLAGMVCMAELVIGIAYMIPSLRRYANVAAFLALTFFVYLTGDNYFSPSLFGQIESCGCFGELIHFTPLGSFLKSLVLWLVVTIILIDKNNTISMMFKATYKKKNGHII